MSKKPETAEAYCEWLRGTHEISINERYRSYYDSVVLKVRMDFEKSGFWARLIDELSDYDQEYQLKHGYQLFMPKFTPELQTKSFESFLLKTFRKNILDNTKWPDEPDGGWFLPVNWLSRINDVIRTLFVVKYLDGVDFLRSKIENLCHDKNMPCETHVEAREEGYYAVHLYSRCSFEVPKIDWDTEDVDFSVEIQITTQLQEVIRRLLHKYYENRRRAIVKPEEKWQWNYRSEEFGANYLGHILHYVEGMIMDIREKQKGK
jgi:hypothetical protein